MSKQKITYLQNEIALLEKENKVLREAIQDLKKHISELTQALVSADKARGEEIAHD